jgi:hypothetical protein
MFNQKSEVKGREGEYDLIIHYDVIKEGGIQDPLGFLFLSTESPASSLEKEGIKLLKESPILQLQIKSLAKEFDQNDHRLNMGKIKKIETLT